MKPVSKRVTDGRSITVSSKENEKKVGSDIWNVMPASEQACKGKV